MPGRRQSQNSLQGSRFGFTIQKDIVLLKSAIQHNPWQLGDDKWKDISGYLSVFYKTSVKKRTVKSRIQTLLKKYRTQKLKSTTGTEEEVSTRGSLLEEICTLVAESEAAIDNTLGAGNSQDFGTIDDFDIVTEFELEEAELSVKLGQTSTKKKLDIAEKKQADKERDDILNKNVAPKPSGLRGKRSLALEDEMIIKRQEHNMQIELRRMKMEEDRLDMEKQRELRKEEEIRRRDEIARSQLDVQNQMLQILANLTKK